MTGGIIQLIFKGNFNYLNNNPEITFFKYVYKKYSNFDFKTLETIFNGNLEFGESLTCNIDLNNELLHTCLLKITLPEVQLNTVTISKDISPIDTFNLTVKNVYIQIVNFEINGQNYDTIINNINSLISNYSDINLLPNSYEIKSNNDLLPYIKTLKKQLELYSLELYEEYNNTTNTYKFSWINNIGYHIIDYIQFKIGDDIINELYGEWLYIWQEIAHDDNYKISNNKLIGNIPELTTYNHKTKNSYELHIPLYFYFHKFNNCVIPLLSLKHQQIQFILKLKKLSQLIILIILILI